MADNKVEILVTSRDKTSLGKMAVEGEAEQAAGRIGLIFERLGANISSHLGNIGKGGGIFAAGSSLLAIASPLAAAGAGVAAFGAVAIPAITAAEAASKKLAAAQLQLANATTPAGKAAAEAAVKNDQLTSSQGKLVNAVGALKSQFGALERALSPMIAGVVQAASKLLTALLPAIGKLATMGGTVLTQFITPFTRFASSPVFKQLIDQFARFGAQMGAIAGPAMVNLLKALMQLFVQLMPAGIQILQVLLPLIVQMVTDLTPTVVVLAKVVAVALKWLAANHLLIPALALLTAGIVVALTAIEATSAPLLLIVAAIALVVVAVTELVKHWRGAWDAIKSAVSSAVGFIRGVWSGIAGVLEAPVRAAAAVIEGIINGIKAAISWITGGGGVGTSGQGIHNGGGVQSRFAHGGITGAAGGGLRSGLTLVGERGRELISLSAGSRVMSNPDTERELAAAGSGPAKVVWEVRVPGSGNDMERFLAGLIRRYVRDQGGGDVQGALGSTG